MSRKYRPSNGTEGSFFIEHWCGRCKRDEAFRNDEGDSCPIVAATFCYAVDDPRYPEEWGYDAEGAACCFAFDAIEAANKRDENAAIGDLFVATGLREAPPDMEERTVKVDTPPSRSAPASRRSWARR